MSDTALAIRTEETKPDFATDAGAVNLASPRLGANVTDVSDEFFAPRERMLEDAPPVFYPDRYDEHGKWMDGWETRRRPRRRQRSLYPAARRQPGIIAGFDLNTRFFTGNLPRALASKGLDRQRPGRQQFNGSNWYRSPTSPRTPP